MAYTGIERERRGKRIHRTQMLSRKNIQVYIARGLQLLIQGVFALTWTLNSVAFYCVRRASTSVITPPSRYDCELFVSCNAAIYFVE
jgi:hypothetical protein